MSSHKKEAYTWAGQTRNVSCMAQSEPAPSFEWQRNRQRIRPNDTFQIFSSGRTSRLQVWAYLYRVGMFTVNRLTEKFSVN